MNSIKLMFYISLSVLFITVLLSILTQFIPNYNIDLSLLKDFLHFMKYVNAILLGYILAEPICKFIKNCYESY
jgi:hypothetical protein